MLEVRKHEDITPAFATLKGKAQALYVCGDELINAFQNRINTLALGARLPTILNNQTFLADRRVHLLWTQLPRPVPARRRLCRQDSARREARRPACRAADEVRHGDQYDDR